MNINNELNEYIQHEKDKFISKIKKHISKIDNELNIKIDYSIIETDNSVIIKGLESYSYFVSKWFNSKINLNRIMVFKSYSNPFLSSDSRISLLAFSLNENFELNKVYFSKTFQNLNYLYTSLNLIFNSNLSLITLKKREVKINIATSEKTMIKEIESLCPYKDELIFFKLSRISSDEVMNLIPEYYIPSAYDFNSVDFVDRLQVYSMLTL